MKDKIYYWCMINLPHWIMYKRVWIDSKSKIYIPRWGWSKKQVEKAKDKAEYYYSKIKWE